MAKALSKSRPLILVTFGFCLLEGLEPKESAGLARHCFTTGIERTFADLDRELVPLDAPAEFGRRTQNTDWAISADGANAFSGSERDIIRFAPVIDEFKKRDEEIVSNSIRFR